MFNLYSKLSFWQDWISQLDPTFIKIANPILTFIVATLVTMLLVKLTHFLFSDYVGQKLTSRFKIDSPMRIKTITNLLQNFIIYTIYFIYIYYVLTMMGIPIGTLIAGAGIFGIAIGLGAKDFFTDIINGFFIIFENKFDVGDLVALHNQDIVGTIISMGLRTTKIQSLTGEIFFVPNSDISIVNNLSMSTRQILIELPYSPEVSILDYRQCVEMTTKAIYDEFHEKIINPPKIIGLIKHPNQTFSFRIIIPVNHQHFYVLSSLLYGRYIEDLQAHHIHLPHYFSPYE